MTKNALFKFEVSFFNRISIETAHQSKKLEKKIQKWQFPRDFIEFVGKTTPDSEKKCCHGPT